MSEAAGNATHADANPTSAHPRQPARIDVHMLTFNEPTHWRAACLASLSGAPIALHILPGLEGALGQARAAGFACGQLPLVAWVDPDDLYEAHAFGQLADALDAHPNAVLAYCDETLIDAQGRLIARRSGSYSAWQHVQSVTHVHGLTVMRRAAVSALAAQIKHLHNGAEWHLTRLLAERGRVLHLPIIGRHWRQHPAQSHRRAPLKPA